MAMAKNSSKGILLFLVSIGIFLAFSLYRIELPGLYEAESYNLMPAVDILYNKDIVKDCYSMTMAGQRFPLMITPFNGALDSYILLPVTRVFGFTVNTIRITQVALAVIGMIFTYILCKRVFNEKIALVSTFLLSINPSFIAFNRQGLLVGSADFALIALSLFAMLAWRLNKKIAYFYLGFFVAGVSIFNNASSLWCLFALFFAYLIIYKDMARGLFKDKELDTDKIVKAACFIFFGAFPFLLYNMHDGETLKNLFASLGSYTKEYGPLWYFRALGNSIKILIGVLSASWRPATWEYARGIANYLYPLASLSALVATPFLILRRQDNALLKKTAFITLVITLILMQSAFALKDLNGYSLYRVYPFVQILIAIFILEAFNFFKKSGFMFIAAFLMMIVFVFMEIFTVAAYHMELNRTGGRGYFSGQMYDLNEFLKKTPYYNAVAMDWGFRYNLLVLSKGEIDAQDFFLLDSAGKGFYDRSESLLRDKNNVYLTHPPQADATRIWGYFKEHALSRGFKLERMDSFCKGDAKEDIIIYKIH